MARTGQPQRWALIALGLAILTLSGHAAAADRLPGPGALAAAGVLCAALAVPLAQRRRSLLGLAGWLLGAQAILHVVVAVTDGHGHGNGLVPGPAMVVAHAVAGLGVAAVVAWADDLLIAWQHLTRTLLGGVVIPSDLVLAAPDVPVDASPLDRRPQRQGHAWAGRRGPPATARLSTS